MSAAPDKVRPARRIGTIATFVVFGLIDLSAPAHGQAPPSLSSQLNRVEQAASAGRLDEANQMLEPLLQLAPNAERVLGLRARLAMARTRPAEALLPLEALRRMHPSVTEYAYLLGVARLTLSDLAGAEVALRGTVELDPNHALAWTGLGLALNGLDRHADGAAVLTEALRLRPENVEARAAYAESLEGLGRLEEARSTAQSVLARERGHGKALLVLGMVHMKEGDFAGARDLLIKALDSLEDSAKAHYQLSLAYARLGERDLARRHSDLYREAQEAVESRTLELRGRAPQPEAQQP